MAMRILNPSHEGHLHDLKGLLAREGFGAGKNLCVTVGACVKEVLSPYLRLHNGSTKEHSLHVLGVLGTWCNIMGKLGRKCEASMILGDT